MKIVRQRKPDRFTVLDNDIIEDQRLSYRTLGVLSYLLSRPDGWETSGVRLAALRKEGRDAVLASLTELQNFGYIARTKIQDPVTGRWSTVMVLKETPTPENPVSGIRRLENRHSVNQASLERTKQINLPPTPKPGSRSARPAEEVPAAVLTAIGFADAFCDEVRRARRAACLPVGRWTTRMILRSLTASFHGGWEPELLREAMLACAVDGDTQSPGRLKHDGDWWTVAEKRTGLIRSSSGRPAKPACMDCTNGWLEDHEGLPVEKCPNCHPALRGATA